MQPDTIINLVAGGALAAFLARLLQQQYEARIDDYKSRITDQSGLLGKLGDALATLTTRVEALTDEVERLERDLSPPRPAKGD